MKSGSWGGGRLRKFATAKLLPVIEIPSKYGTKINFALIDTGSTDTLITRDCANRFDFKVLKSNILMEITGVAGEGESLSELIELDLGNKVKVQAMTVESLPGHQLVIDQINPEGLESSALNSSSKGRHFKGFDLIICQSDLYHFVTNIKVTSDFIRYDTIYGCVYSICNDRNISESHKASVHMFQTSKRNIIGNEPTTIKRAIIPPAITQQKSWTRCKRSLHLDSISDLEQIELLFDREILTKNVKAFHARVQQTPLQILNGYWAKFFAFEDMSVSDESMSFEEIQSKNKIQTPGFLLYSKNRKKFATELLLKDDLKMDNNYNLAKARLENLMKTLTVSKEKTEVYRKEISKFLELDVA